MLLTNVFEFHSGLFNLIGVVWLNVACNDVCPICHKALNLKNALRGPLLTILVPLDNFSQLVAYVEGDSSSTFFIEGAFGKFDI